MRRIKKVFGNLRFIMKLKLLLGFALIYAITSVNAQNATKYSNEFLQIGVGARSLAMGGSSVASTRDVYSGYWNPAGLTGIDGNSQVSLMHAAYFAGIANYDYGAFATKLSNNNAFGISLVRFGIDGIANTFDLIRNGEIDYSRVTSFNSTDFAAIVSYGQEDDLNIRKFRHMDFAWGMNMKIIRRKIGPFAKSFGFGFDAGIKLKNDEKNWSFGIVLRDATSTFNSWRYTFTDAQKDVLAATQNAIPQNSLEITLPRLLFGAAKEWEIDNWSILTEYNADLTLDGKRNTLLKTDLFSIDPYLGAELGYQINDKNKVFFRTGFNNVQKYTNKSGNHIWSVRPNAGVGIVLNKITIDYALTNLSALSGSGPSLYSNIFSLKLEINK